MYIPIAQKRRIRSVKAVKGRSASILRLEPKPKKSKRTEDDRVIINNRVDSVRMYIPKVFCFIRISSMFTLKE
jgi:hypothetical protein